MCRAACRKRRLGLETGQCRHSSPLRSQLPRHARRYAAGSASDVDYRSQYRDDFRQQVAGQLDELHAMVEKLCQRAASAPAHDLPEALFHVFTDMIEAEVDEIDRPGVDRSHPTESRLARAGRPAAREGARRAAVGGRDPRRRPDRRPTPTSAASWRWSARPASARRRRSPSWRPTIACAKSAASGLITVDTYRVAAVEQLRTYADIIDLPMEVVATPREMREAVARMSHLDLVLMDTAGRSPRDEVKIQELKSMLAEAEPDEVHLVLSSTAGAKSLIATAEHFADVGTTAMLLTKLDEATSLGHLVSLVRECRLPISYLTDGQNVPDDIQVAERRRLAYMLLGIE